MTDGKVEDDLVMRNGEGSRSHGVKGNVGSLCLIRGEEEKSQ